MAPTFDAQTRDDRPRRFLTIQPSEYVDEITDDGVELTKLPYPYHCNEQGDVDRQDFWQGTPIRVLGFVRDLKDQRVDIWWWDVWKDPQRAIGTFVVIQDADGSMGSIPHSVQSVEEVF